MKLALAGSYVYVTDGDPSSLQQSARVLRLPKAGGDAVVLAADEPSAWGVAVLGDDLCWTRIGTPQADYADGALRRLILGTDGGSPSTLQTPAAFPTAVALDAHNVYWVESGVAPGFNNGTVRALPQDGGLPVVLADGGFAWSPGYLAIDDSFVYWTAEVQVQAQGVVGRVPLGGGTMETIATTSHIPTSIVLDAENVYWVEWSQQRDSATIAAASHSGANPRTLWSGQGLIPFDLAIDGTALYWTEDLDAGGVGRVMKLSLAGGAPVTLAANEYDPFGIAVDDTSVYWTTSSPPNAPGTGSVRRLAK
ncbi:MAG TPA: hypothetical protein VLM85_09620 [Polyangiaceae bacterium]|nr:hypothetical protein [Polyangiaceae bacterium]